MIRGEVRRTGVCALPCIESRVYIEECFTSLQGPPATTLPKTIGNLPSKCLFGAKSAIIRHLMSTCHTAGRVWEAFEANPLCAKWMTVRRWANVLTGRLLV